MGYRAVALSQVDGAGGESVGPEVAKRLGFGYLNDAIVSKVAEDSGTAPSTVAQAERRKSFLEKVALAAARGGVEGMSGPQYLDDTSTFLGLIREAVVDAAARGDVVLGAHAACYACADQADVLRVSITAPMETRVARAAVAKGVSDKDAARDLKKSDAGRAAYLKQVYGVNEEAPDDYDVVINTERITPEAAVDLIVGLVQA